VKPTTEQNYRQPRAGWNLFRRRRVALLGGTTTFADFLVAAGLMFNPFRIVRGPAIREYEEAFARRLCVRHAYSFSAGRVGFYALLRALGVGPGDEVLLQVPTHIVVSNAIRYTGARPVYVDCQPEDYNMDLDEAKKQITPRTKVLLLQHTFGIPADLERALALVREHRISLIEDCVHALGARYNGRPVGSYGRAAFFSTEETKTITSTMGGVVVTNDTDLAKRIEAFQATCAWPSPWLTARYMLKFILYYLLTEPHLHVYTRVLYELLGRRQPIPGATTSDEQRGARPSNYTRRLANAQAVIALRQLRRLDSNLAHRRMVADTYAERLSRYGFRLPQLPANAEAAFVRYPICVEDRVAAQRAAAPYTVLGIWFTSVLEEAQSPTFGDYQIGSCPTAEAVAQTLTNLPTHPRVSREDVELIIGAVQKLMPSPAPLCSSSARAPTDERMDAFLFSPRPTTGTHRSYR
jgi:perosamine synthetase